MRICILQVRKHYNSILIIRYMWWFEPPTIQKNTMQYLDCFLISLLKIPLEYFCTKFLYLLKSEVHTPASVDIATFLVQTQRKAGKHSQ